MSNTVNLWTLRSRMAKDIPEGRNGLTIYFVALYKWDIDLGGRGGTIGHGFLGLLGMCGSRLCDAYKKTQSSVVRRLRGMPDIHG